MMAASMSSEQVDDSNNVTAVMSKIRLFFSNGKCYVWNSADARTLREDCRIVGGLVGCLPRAPRQNVHLGLPISLMEEEVTLLLEKGLAELVEEAYTAPTDQDITDFKEQRRESYLEQVTLHRAERQEEIKRRLPEIIEAKKAKRRRLLEEKQKAGLVEKAELTEGAESKEDKDLEAEIMQIPSIKERFSLVELPLESQTRSRTSCKTVPWTYPHTPMEKLRYQVFKEFWENGLYLTSGSKFGGDFLVYPGDPSRFHSLYVAVCLPYHEQLTVLDVITMGRLGSNVKKTVILCSRDDEGKICQTSLQWTGVS